MADRSAQPDDSLQVKGLSKVDDILLKWLAEYTRRCPNDADGGFSACPTGIHMLKLLGLHPWRFVYLEGRWRGCEQVVLLHQLSLSAEDLHGIAIQEACTPTYRNLGIMKKLSYCLLELGDTSMRGADTSFNFPENRREPNQAARERWRKHNGKIGLVHTK